MPFKNKEDKNAYQRQYWINNPEKYREHKKQCCENMRRIRSNDR